MAQSVENPNLDFSSGHDVRVLRSSLMLGSALSRESARDSLPLLSQINKSLKKNSKGFLSAVTVHCYRELHCLSDFCSF